ncbi:type IV toxin-antitoxin system AbiEi family antitoxin domain-containing protein [Enterobacter roggenkampii]|uniref:type IV toxin-antitoxin system AbiEi family antitoxin domain-containing protein n=1 Tax=Enterobacter roggenkampii TaxID=1812935 RepID=UPI00044AE94E|nr:hypothetical protein M002_27690 [Pseudomonas aeruginosa ID4365]MCK6980701.1 type IV toxin-antitoxin system AbiEi family antitoxin [Enterobacter roggenkampii]
MAFDWIFTYIYLMNGFSRHQVIKRLQADLPRGAPFDLQVLETFGVSPQLAARYVESGWLVRIGHGIYAFPNDNFDVTGALRFLQQRVAGLHVGGKSALATQGVRHNLSTCEPLVLWGEARFSLQPWFSERFPARYVNARLFDWPDTGLADTTLHTPPGQPRGLQVAVPERAVLEMLYEAGTRQSLEEVRNLFDGLRSPHKDLLGQLLACCTSVKTVRLFLTWARETGVIDVDALVQQFPVRAGSTKRWMSRMLDGTLLSLKTYG